MLNHLLISNIFIFVLATHRIKSRVFLLTPLIVNQHQGVVEIYTQPFLKKTKASQQREKRKIHLLL